MNEMNDGAFIYHNGMMRWKFWPRFIEQIRGFEQFYGLILSAADLCSRNLAMFVNIQVQRSLRFLSYTTDYTTIEPATAARF